MKTRFSTITGASLREEHLLLKRIDTIQTNRKINKFATFIPSEILKLRGMRSEIDSIHQFVGVLLHVDITTVTRLIERSYKLGLGELYKIRINLNAYLGSIIEMLRSYGGDVLSILSNGFITLWKVEPEQNLYELLHMVVECANTIHTLLGIHNTDLNIPLRPKTVVSCGNVTMAITGNNKLKQFVMLGDAFELLKSYTSAAKYGEIVVTGSAWTHMLHERYTIQMTKDSKYIRILKIIYKSSEIDKKAYFDKKYASVHQLVEMHYAQRQHLIAQMTAAPQFMSKKYTKNFVNKLPPRKEISDAIKYWGLEEMQPFINEIVYVQILESQPVNYLTEVREITAVSFKVIPVELDNTTLMSIVNTILDIIVEAVRMLRFTINNITISESSININIILGILLINHQNESSNALRHAYAIQQDFKNIATVKEVSVGVSSGIVFCSVVGHPLRREYVIVGRPVMQAQKLARNYPQKVTCDENIFETSRLSSLYFKIIKFREEHDPECIFQYDETWGNTDAVTSMLTLIDRVAEYDLIVNMIQNPDTTNFSGICLHGPEMIGKTKLLKYVHQSLSAPSSGYWCVYVALHSKTTHPYACVSEIYRKMFDKLVKQNRDVDAYDLPKVLYDFNAGNRNEDFALQKYRILNRFRDIVRVVPYVIVLLIDNVELMDFLSWEIIELTFPRKNLRLVLAGVIDGCTWKLGSKIGAMEDIKVLEITPLKSRFILPLVCSYLHVVAVCNNLIELLQKTCGGNPGYVECCVLRLINNNTLVFKLCDRKNINRKQYQYKNLHELSKTEAMFAVVDFKGERENVTDLTMDIIYLDLFDSFTPFQQLVVKTASVLGTVFGRTLLIVALNYPQDSLLSETIKILFNEKVFECGSALVSDDVDIQLCCRCYFDASFWRNERNKLPRYAYCKLIHFRHKNLRNVAYKSIAENQRRELHILCGDVLEKMQHVCPNCVRNPASYYAFFDTYTEFLKFCDNPFYSSDYFTYANDSYESIKAAINAHLVAQPQLDEEEEEQDDIRCDQTYMSILRNFDVSACRCIDMRYMLYQDIIVHASCAQEDGKVIFYTLKFGMIQLWMLDLEGAIRTFEKIRELCISLIDSKANNNFRKYHIGKASIGLARCYLMLQNLPAAKNNMILALRQYNIPTLAFNFKQFRILLHRKHLHSNTRKPYATHPNFFNWELGIAMMICSKIFAIDDCWKLARDCLNFSIAMIKSANSNIAILMDHYSDAIDIFRKAGDNETCERMQKYLIREFHTKYAGKNVLYFSAFIDFLQVVIVMHLERGNLKIGVRLGYRLIHIADMNQVAVVEAHTLMLIAEVSIYMFSFRDFIDVFNILSRRLAHSKDYVSQFNMCMLCYNYTGFHMIKFHDILHAVQDYFGDSMQLSNGDILLKLQINIQLLRRRLYNDATTWDVSFDHKTAKAGNVVNVKIMLSQMEVFLLRLEHAQRNREPIVVNALKISIDELFKTLKLACNHNLMYKPAYMCMQSWYYMLKNKKSKASALLKKAYNFSKKCDNLYYMALISRVKNHWEGGFNYEYNQRPKVAINKAPTFTYSQFIQFLPPFVID